MIKDTITQLIQHKQTVQSQIENLQFEVGKIDQALASLSTIEGGAGAGMPSPFAEAATDRKKGGMSAAGRARIIAAQKARWAQYHAQQGPAAKAVKPGKKKIKFTAAGLARIREAQKKRWAAYNKARAGK